jgi:hypothetical protein
MSTKLLALGIGLGMLVFIVDLVRRERLTFKYAFGWLLVLSAGIFLVVFDNIVCVAAGRLGFALPSNFIFFAGTSGFLLMSVLLTIFLCQQNERNDKMAQRIGLLEEEVERIKKERDARDVVHPGQGDNS